MKKRFTYLLLMLFMCVTSSWAIEAYDVGSDNLSSASRAAESTPFTLKGDGVITYTFTNYTNPDDEKYDYNWHLYCTNTSETKDDETSTNRYFILHAQGSAEAYNGTGTATLSDNYKCTSAFDFLTWNNEATGKITITRSGDNIKVEAVFTKEGTEYTCSYNFYLKSEYASSETKFFLANGRHNYLHVTDESSQAFDYSTIYLRALDRWAASDITQTVGTVGSWYSTTFTTDATNGLYQEALKGNSSAVLTYSPSNNSIQTIDAVFSNLSNAGDAGNYSYMKIGSAIEIQSNQQNQNGAIILNGTSYAINDCNLKNYNRGGDLWTIHAVINTATNTLTEFTLKGTEMSGKSANYTLDSPANLGMATYNTIEVGTHRVNGTPAVALNSISILDEKQSVETAQYKIQYFCGTEEVKTASIRSGVIGQAIALSNSDKEGFFNADNTKKYIYDSDDSEGKTISSDGSTVVTVKFTETAKCEYSVVSSLGDVIASGSEFPGETISYAYPRYINHEGTLYTATKQSSNPWWGSSFTLTENNQKVTINYTATNITDVVYFTETEDIAGATVVTKDNTDIRCSNKAAGNYNGKLLNLEAGTYKLGTSLWGGAGTTITFTAGGETILAATTTGSIADFTSDPFVLTEATDIYVSGMSGSKNADLIYIVKSPPIYKYTVKAMDGETELGTITSGRNEAGKEIYWSKYQKYGDKWYEMPSTYMTVSATESENEIKLAATASNIIYFTECENMTSSYKSKWAASLSGKGYSNGVSPRHYVNSYWYSEAVSTENGIYSLSMPCQNNNSTATTLAIYYRDADGTLHDTGKTFECAGKTATTVNVIGIEIPANCSLVLYNTTSYNSNVYIDYVTLEPYDPCTWTVKTSLGGTLASGTNNKGTTVSYAYPRYINKEGTLYGATKQTDSPWWGSSFTLDENDKTVTVDYTETDIKDVVYFSEVEDIEGATVVTNGNADIRCSNKKAGAFEGKITTLEAGSYKISTSVWGKADATITFKAGENTILEAVTTGSIKDYTSDSFTLTESTDITMAGCVATGNSPQVADFVYIYKYDPTAINNVNANASTSSAQAQGKYLKNGKLIIVKNGRTYNAAGAAVK